MNEFYTYFHTRNDTGSVFYVGKGRGSRCRTIHGRGNHWSRIVAKHGHTVHMAMTHLTEQEAFEHEKFLILCFKDMGTSLCNQTDGGEGVSGLVCSAETRAKIGLAIKGNSHTPEVRARISAKLSVLQMGNTRGKGHDVGEKVMAMMTGNKLFAGHKHTDEWRAKRSAFRHSDETKAKMSAARMGNQNARKHKTELNETP